MIQGGNGGANGPGAPASGSRPSPFIAKIHQQANNDSSMSVGLIVPSSAVGKTIGVSQSMASMPTTQSSIPTK